jgi:hypothetical protein
MVKSGTRKKTNDRLTECRVALKETSSFCDVAGRMSLSAKRHHKKGLVVNGSPLSLPTQLGLLEFVVYDIMRRCAENRRPQSNAPRKALAFHGAVTRKPLIGGSWRISDEHTEAGARKGSRLTRHGPAKTLAFKSGRQIAVAPGKKT